MLRGRERREAIAPVESVRTFVLGIDDYGADGYRITRTNDSTDHVEQQCLAKSLSLVGMTNCQPPDHGHWNRIVRQLLCNFRWQHRLLDAGCAYSVVTSNLSGLSSRCDEDTAYSPPYILASLSANVVIER